MQQLFYSIYMVLGIINNLEMIWRLWEDMCRLYANTRQFYQGTRTFEGFDTHKGSWNLSFMYTKGVLSLPLICVQVCARMHVCMFQKGVESQRCQNSRNENQNSLNILSGLWILYIDTVGPKPALFISEGSAI